MNLLPKGDKRLGEIEQALMSTGVVHGEFGFVEACALNHTCPSSKLPVFSKCDTNVIIKYFAYGSNMCSGRLRDRVPCEFVAIAKLARHQLRFHKLSKKDRSSKCDAFHTDVAADELWGVVYDITAAKKPALDEFEGLGYGYEDVEVVVTLPTGEQLAARTYVADPQFIREGLAPYSWYKAYVQAGAVEHGLPLEYVAALIEAVTAEADPDQGRHDEETAKLHAWSAKDTKISPLRQFILDSPTA